MDFLVRWEGQQKTKNVIFENGREFENFCIKNYKEIWGTNIFAKDIEGVAKAGDLIMTLDDGTRTGKVIYYRLLRRIK